MKIIGLILALIDGNSSKPSDQKRELQYDFDDLVSISCVASGFKVSFVEFSTLKFLQYFTGSYFELQMFRNAHSSSYLLAAPQGLGRCYFHKLNDHLTARIESLEENLVSGPVTCNLEVAINVDELLFKVKYRQEGPVKEKQKAIKLSRIIDGVLGGQVQFGSEVVFFVQMNSYQGFETDLQNCRVTTNEATYHNM